MDQIETAITAFRRKYQIRHAIIRWAITIAIGLDIGASIAMVFRLTGIHN